MHVDSQFISTVIPQVQALNQPLVGDANFNVDSRTIQPGEIFVALVGSQVDGHDFIEQALQRGAAGFILALSKKEWVLKKFEKELRSTSVLFVPDPLTALIDLARAWRSKFIFPVIGITGTVGKTTTKEIVRNILKLSTYNAIVSSGNQNTMIGASLNILKIRPEHNVAVFELGISETGVMKKLVELVRPTYSVITRVGHGHMLGLGDISSVAREKRDIFGLFTDRDIGIINGDQPELANISYKHPVISFGKKTTNQIQARKIICAQNSLSFLAKIYKKRYQVVLPTCNEARVMNALAAIAIGYLLQIPDEILIRGVEMPVSVEGRFQLIQQASGATLINDAYNANPESMKASLQAFDQFSTQQQKVAVLGDMLELGQDSAFWHRQIGRFLRKVHDLTLVVLIGKEIEWTKKTLPYGVKCIYFPNIDDAFETIRNLASDSKNVILFKSSRSVKLIELVKKLQA